MLLSDLDKLVGTIREARELMIAAFAQYDAHDFWCQVAIVGLMQIAAMNEQALGYGYSRTGVDDYNV